MSRREYYLKLEIDIIAIKLRKNVKQIKEAHIVVFTIITHMVEVVQCHGQGGGVVVWKGSGVGWIRALL